jgi:multicomponent Na+:H+ antiporter subunit B
MNSFILQVALRLLFPVILLVSLYVMFRGHNEPGGGFIGGLLAASAIILKTFVNGLEETERLIKVKPLTLIITGLTLAFTSALLPLFFDLGFFEGLWADFYLPFFGRPGTPMMFDLGVFFVVIGITSKIIFSIGD